MSERGFGGRLGACLLFEGKKLVLRRLPWLTLAATVLTAAATGWLEASGDDAPKSYALYAAILGNTMPVATFFLLIMGCLAVNEEIGSGAMRAMLLRPVTRIELLLSKILVLLAFALAVSAAGIAASWAWVAAFGEFRAVILDLDLAGLEPVVKFDGSTMRSFAWKLSASLLPAVLCAPLFGVLISLMIDAAGSAVAVGVFLFGLMKTLGQALDGGAEWLFPSYVDRPIALLAELAQGVETHVATVLGMGLFSSQVLWPCLMMAILAGASLACFRMKEIPC